MWKRVYESWYSETLNILEALYNSMPRRIADLIKKNRGATKYQAIVMKAYEDAVEFPFECT